MTGIPQQKGAPTNIGHFIEDHQAGCANRARESPSVNGTAAMASKGALPRGGDRTAVDLDLQIEVRVLPAPHIDSTDINLRLSPGIGKSLVDQLWVALAGEARELETLRCRQLADI
jgi:hypothetical protein